MDENETGIAEKFKSLSELLDEQQRRLWAATEARALGYGGVSIVARATGLTRPTIVAGLKELDDTKRPASTKTQRRVRRAGAGRPRVTHGNAELLPALEQLVEPTTRGDPKSPLRWTCKSVREAGRGADARRATAVSHQTRGAAAA